jgi:hypothetical protein
MKHKTNKNQLPQKLKLKAKFRFLITNLNFSYYNLGLLLCIDNFNSLKNFSLQKYLVKARSGVLF